MRHLRDRGPDLEAAGIRPFAISLDHPWSQKAWAETLGVDNVRFVSDRLGEATRGLGIMTEYQGLPMAARWVFLVQADSVRASWQLTDSPLPDVDVIIAAASSS